MIIKGSSRKKKQSQKNSLNKRLNNKKKQIIIKNIIKHDWLLPWHKNIKKTLTVVGKI